MNDLPNLTHCEITSDIIFEWCDEDETRYELLAKAIIAKKINYEFNDDDPRTLLAQNRDLKGSMRSVLIRDLIAIDEDSFQMLKDTSSPPTKQSVTEFFSDELQIAVDISRKLYPEKPTGFNPDDRAERSKQKELIESELKDYDLAKSTRDFLAKIINPYPRTSYSKK